MLFNSFDFLVFFPVVVAVFFVIPRKSRSVWLLLASYYFYMSWNPRYALLIALSTVITYACGLSIELCAARGFASSVKKLCVAASLIFNLMILCVFKYANFLLANLDGVLAELGFSVINRRLDLLLPVGISFYTFQALSYTIDVYRGRLPAEHHFIRYALFVSFFPQLVAGPIERSGNLLRQIQQIESIRVWDFDRVRDGLLLMLWGLFQKLVIADRAALLVSNVINNYWEYGFLELSVAAVLFAFQIYCDFGGYSDITRGAAKVMGFSLVRNFRQPYLATSIQQFWRRWHISLTSWFTDYLYIPLGGNRKGLLRKYLNILAVFAVSGLWHGASWNFVAWGLIHAAYQIVGDCCDRFKKRLPVIRTPDSFSKRLRRRLFTFLLVDIGWVFFISSGFRHAIAVFRQMFTVFQTTSIYALGLDSVNWMILLSAIVLLLITDIAHEKGLSVFSWVNHQEFYFRWILYLGLIWAIIMFGIYGVAYDSSQFIYFQF